MTADLPGIDSDRMKWAYPDIFMYTLIWNVALAVIASFALWLILFIIKMCVIKPKQRQQEQ